MAAIATLGRVDGTRDDWLQYVERLEHFFSANGVDDADKKRSVLLTVIGAATYKTLRISCRIAPATLLGSFNSFKRLTRPANP